MVHTHDQTYIGDFGNLCNLLLEFIVFQGADVQGVDQKHILLFIELTILCLIEVSVNLLDVFYLIIERHRGLLVCSILQIILGCICHHLVCD
jgi:hypothetical protein